MGLAAAGLSFLPALAVGSFLNVVAARVPLKRSIVRPPLGVHVLRAARSRGTTTSRSCRGSCSAAAAAPAAPRSPGATRRSSSRRRCSSPAASGSSGSRWDAAIALVLLRRARRPLGDRHRAADRPEPDRPPGRRDRARRADRRPPVGRVARGGLGASLFLFLAALAYPRGMGMGDVKLALLLGFMVGRSVPVGLFAGMIAALVPSAVLFARHGAKARKMAIPFAPFLALGGLLALFCGPPAPGRVPRLPALVPRRRD